MADLNIVHWTGILAAMASIISFAPQAWKTIATRDVDSLSGAMYALTVLAFALWVAYGVLKVDWALIVPNALCLMLSSFILVMIIVPQTARDHIADVVGTPSGNE